MKTKVYTPREFDKLLRKNGYIHDRTRGDHLIYKGGGGTLSFNLRGLNPVVCKRLIKEHALVV